MSGSKGGTLDQTNIETAPKVKESKQWALVLWNNDVTPFEVVLDVLIQGLKFNRTEAYNLMMEAHSHEYSVILKASKSICEVKHQIATEYCKEAHKASPYHRYNYLVFSVEET